MKAGLFVRRTGLGGDPTEDVTPPLRPAPPLAKRLNRNALTVAAVVMGMTVLTAIVLLNPGKESQVSRAASANAETVPQIPARPAFLDEPLPRSLRTATTDSSAPASQPTVNSGAGEPAYHPLSAPSERASENGLARGVSQPRSESPRERGYQAALMSSAVPGGVRPEPSPKTPGDSPAAPTEEEQLVTLGDSIMRSALRQNAALAGQAPSSNADRSSVLSNQGASHQSFWTRAAEAAAKTTTPTQLNPAGSPYTLRAGTLIPALLITGITSAANSSSEAIMSSCVLRPACWMKIT